MVSAIGSSPAASSISTTVTSTAAIEAQIARDRKELSNCINCESAETKQGQADIQALSNKINIAKARLEQITSSNPANQLTALGSATETSGTAESGSATKSNNVVSALSIAESKTSSEPASSPVVSDADTDSVNTGRLVDVFA